MSYITDFNNFKEAHTTYAEQQEKIQKRLNQSIEVVYNVARKVQPPAGWENATQFEWMRKNFDKTKIARHQVALESNTREVAKLARKTLWAIKKEEKQQAKRQVAKEVKLAKSTLVKAQKDLEKAEAKLKMLK